MVNSASRTCAENTPETWAAFFDFPLRRIRVSVLACLQVEIFPFRTSPADSSLRTLRRKFTFLAKIQNTGQCSVPPVGFSFSRKQEERQLIIFHRISYYTRGLLLILQAAPWFRRENNWKEAIVRWFADHFEHDGTTKWMSFGWFMRLRRVQPCKEHIRHKKYLRF